MKLRRVGMDFNDKIKAEALKWAKRNAIAMPGEIVETQWGDWKRPHKVRISKVGCCLSAKHDGEWKATLEMFYIAERLKPDGTSKEKNGSGIVLDHFRKEDGRTWRQSHLTINHAAYHWYWKSLDA